ncbi:SOS response-associated peptidase [Actinomycetes bacterium M1A6_2h]
MCGRYANTRSDADLSSMFDIALALDDELPPNYNVAPTDPVRIVLDRVLKDHPEDPPVRQLRTARWGLIPSWAKDRKIGARMINARSESVTEKPAFKKAAASRRCIVPADGYFEWEKRDGAKVPYFLHGSEDVIAMAGLYEFWRDSASDEWVVSCTVLTTSATDSLGHIHDRSPVIVPADLRTAWLDPTLTDAAELLRSIPEPTLEPYEVSSAVNSVRNNGPELLAPV